MSKQKKSPRDNSPEMKPPVSKKRNSHGKKEPKETIAAEAIVAAKKAEAAPASPPSIKTAEPAPAASPPSVKKAEAAPVAPPRPAPKTPAPPPAPKVAPAAKPAQRPQPAFAGAADSLERSLKEARQGTVAVNRKLIDFARANVNSSLDHVRDLAAARTPVRMIRLQMEFWHDCLETFASQAQELRALSAECVARASEPIRQHMRGRPPA